MNDCNRMKLIIKDYLVNCDLDYKIDIDLTDNTHSFTYVTDI